MKKVYLFIILLISVNSLSAKITMEEAWKSMPDSIIPYLNAGLRTEMIDLYNGGHATETKNILEGNSRILQVKADFAEIRLNSSAIMQLQLYDKLDSTQVICMIKTYGTPAVESEIAFYTTNWERINGNMGLPDMSDASLMANILTAKSDTMDIERYEELKGKLEPITVVAEIKAKDIVFTPVSVLLTKEEKNLIDQIILQKSFKWNGEIFK